MMSVVYTTDDDAAALAGIVQFQQEVTRRQAERVVAVPGGFAVFSPRYAFSYDHNKLVLTAPVDDAPGLADHVLGGAGLEHRLVVVDDDGQGAFLAEAFVHAGYEHDVNLVMRFAGAPDEPAAAAVVDAALDELCDIDRREWAAALPDAPSEVVDQLVTRRVTRLGAADEVAFLAVRNEAGDVVARADLYVDRTSGIAQIEDVATDHAHRNRGFARALLAEGRRRAEEAGATVLFLVASADDWPRELYARLGYRTIGRGHVFRRRP